MRRVLILLLLIAVVAAAYYSTRSKPMALVLTGIVTTEDVIVAPQVGGRIGQVLVKEGDEIKRDQLVAVMVSDELQAERAFHEHNIASIASQVGENEAQLRYEQRQTEDRIQQAEANLQAAISQQAEAAAALENAKIFMDRTQKLSEQGVAPAQQLDQARTSYDAAKARVETMARQAEAQRAAVALARTNSEQVVVRQSRVRSTEQQRQAAAAQRAQVDVRLSYSEVRAPIDGIVDVRASREGEVIIPGQPIVTLINPDDLWVRADVEETYIDRIRLGDQLKVRLPSGEERTGTVFYRAADAGFATQRDVSRIKRDIKTFEIRLRVDNKDRHLAVGMTIYVDLPI
ncbi:MAG TPA: efflux RND transporter periplasmic adaptor subunit [Terriglobia bacterium]|nr:efflux RND transporter periplasmic adaptor subunit [Terriglobia bacterium]